MTKLELRERALMQESWCAVKHLICAEEHVLETVQKMLRERNKNEKLREIYDPYIEEMLIIADKIRLLRQRIVDIMFELGGKLRGEKNE